MSISGRHIPLIGIAGGIGSGKSMVSRILRLRGLHVYDCDYQARIIMDSSQAFLDAVKDRFGTELFSDDGVLNRELLARKLFNDRLLRSWINGVVHPLVLDDVKKWVIDIEAKCGCSLPVFVESAIMATSRLHTLCDAVWLVEAPVEERISRVTARNGLSPQQIQSRIAVQENENEILRREVVVKIIQNAAEDSLIPQIDALLSKIDALLFSSRQDRFSPQFK